MDNVNENAPQTFLNEVADKIDAAAAQLDGSAVEPANGQVVSLSSGGSFWRPRFAQKLVYSSCYTLSFGVCFPVFFVCGYIPKNNPLVQGLIEGSAAASADVDAWLSRSKVTKTVESLEDALVAEAGAGALAPA